MSLLSLLLIGANELLLKFSIFQMASEVLLVP